jgi:hypothetical protein
MEVKIASTVKCTRAIQFLPSYPSVSKQHLHFYRSFMEKASETGKITLGIGFAGWYLP